MKIYKVTNAYNLYTDAYGRTLEIYFEDEDDARKYVSGFSDSPGVTTIDVFQAGSVNSKT